MQPRLVSLAIGLAAAALVVSSCSKDSPDTSAAANDDSASTSSDDPALAEAAEAVEAALVEPTSVGVTEPLSKKPETGKNVTFLQCGVGICQQIGDELDEAAEVLGWNMTYEDLGTTPEQIVAAWDRALSANPKPDAILTSGVPVVVFQRELDQAREAGIEVVDWASANPPDTPGITFDINPVEDNELRGKLLADYAAVTLDGAANSVFVNVPDFPTLVAEQKAYDAELAKVCEGCTNEVLDFSATDIGTKVPSAIVSHLQQNPDVNLLVMSFDDMSLGVPEALRAAGLDGNVQIIGQSGSEATAESIAEGRGQTATIPQGVGQMAYKALDVLARAFNGDSLEADENLLPIWIQTQETIGDPKDLWKGPEGYQDEFAELWKASDES